MTKRFAIFFSPPAQSPLWHFGCRWLGRDAEQDCLLPLFSVPGFTRDELLAMTAAPRQYGLHGTLKPPFMLSDTTSEGALRDAMQAFARRWRAFTLPLLQLDRIGGFLALRPASPCEALHQLAEACVREFDRFRRHLEDSELQRRRVAGLTQRQEELLNTFGYPYVLDQFRFHLTLTGRLDNDIAARLRPWLDFELGAALTQPESVHELCLFVQHTAGETFRLDQRFAFGTG